MALTNQGDRAAERPRSEGPLRQVAADAFGSGAGTLTDRLATAGLPPQDAEDLAVTLLEGAHVQCRAAGNLGPCEQVARAVNALVRSRYPG